MGGEGTGGWKRVATGVGVGVGVRVRAAGEAEVGAGQAVVSRAVFLFNPQAHVGAVGALGEASGVLRGQRLPLHLTRWVAPQRGWQRWLGRGWWMRSLVGRCGVGDTARLRGRCRARRSLSVRGAGGRHPPTPPNAL